MASQPDEIKQEPTPGQTENGHVGTPNPNMGTPRPQRQRNRGGGGGGGPRRSGGGGPPHNQHNQHNPQQDRQQQDTEEIKRPRMSNINERGPGGGPGGRFNGPRSQNDREQDRINERLMSMSGPTHELPQLDVSEKKFSGRNRLYIGNLTNDASEDEIKEMFQPYGETSELFLNKEKNFAFVRLDYRASAEKAKRELDGTMRKGRTLKIRFAPNGAAIKVKNLTQYVTNELLYTAFSVFGEIERCVIIVDDHGKSTCEGIVEFARKPSAQSAIRRCNEGCFFLTASLRPVTVEPYEILDEIDGYSEKVIGKRGPDFYKAREQGPRFANPGSFEHEYGTRWKQLIEIFKQKQDALKREMIMEEEKLEAQMEYARYEHETELLREQLRARELDRERQKREWEMKERQVEEQRAREEEHLRRMQEEMQMRMSHQEEDLRRRQEENNLFLKAHQLSDMLDQQERSGGYDTTIVDVKRDFDTSATGGMPPDPKTFLDNYDRSNDRYDDGGMSRMSMGGRGHWGNDRRDDYQNKRRRY